MANTPGEGIQDEVSLPPMIDGVTFMHGPNDPPIRGSVQELTPVAYEGRACLVARTTDAGSVFDYGKHAELYVIPGSGELRTAVRDDIFRALADPNTWKEIGEDDLTACFDAGTAQTILRSDLLERFRRRGVRTHHIGMIDTSTEPAGIIAQGDDRRGRISDMVLVERFGVIPPDLVDGSYDYSRYHKALNSEEPVVYGVEHLFRLGNAGGSSLQVRYDALRNADLEEVDKQTRIAQLLEPFGLTPPLNPWTLFPSMTSDYTSKYEDQDRPLDLAEATKLMGGPFVAEHIQATLALCTAYVRKHFANLGLQLWDLKWEVGTNGYELVVVDTLDPDGVRVTAQVEYASGQMVRVHFNKQAVRDYYRILYPEWVGALAQAKKRSLGDPSRNWYEIYQEGVTGGLYPPTPELEPAFANLQRRKYEYIARGGYDPSALSQIADDEIAFYASKGTSRLAAFLALNSMPAAAASF